MAQQDKPKCPVCYNSDFKLQCVNDYVYNACTSCGFDRVDIEATTRLEHARKDDR